jgi:purine-cytosine permease-like protein
MAEGAARVDDLEQGALPAICAKTGVPCDGLVKDTLRVIPRWVPPLAILLIVPYFVARAYTSRRIEAKLPISPERMERIRRLVRVSWIALVAAAAGFSSLFFGAGVIGLAAFVGGLLAYLVIVYVGDQMWVGARPSSREDVVILTRVHPAFARALPPVADN